ncbi:hypothetical protein ACIQK6_24005 [Streptomyces sp. NPDC091682]|uniref:hypothetical protein n=1 Tax=unclassified Streptomyces TaxID=2593676 RepID=UPI0037239950
MSEALPEEPPAEPPQPSVNPPVGMNPEDFEFWDDATLTFYERRSDGIVVARPYSGTEVAHHEEELTLDSLHDEAGFAIDYLDGRIDLSLAYLALPAPTDAETAAQVRVLSDLSAYSAGTLKRLIKVLAVMLNKPI